MNSTKWDRRLLEMAQLVGSWSKDPNIKLGAVIARADNTIVSVGYNGFAPGVFDSDKRLLDRELKLELTIHAEENALLLADRSELRSAIIYTWPLPPCSNCAAKLIRVGIKRIVSLEVKPTSNWAKSVEQALLQFKEANVEVGLYHE